MADGGEFVRLYQHQAKACPQQQQRISPPGGCKTHALNQQKPQRTTERSRAPTILAQKPAWVSFSIEPVRRRE
jgi:hypothetical protein